MGSLKDEKRGLKPCEKADDGERPGGSDGGAVPEGPEINASQESTSRGDCEPELHMNASYAKEMNPVSKELSGEDCDNQSDSIEAISDEVATCNDEAVSNNLLSVGDGDIQVEEKTVDHDREKKAEIEKISVAVPATPGPFDPRSPAPAGQHHMRTQVSLEVVQCHSAATSPMTPPENDHSFFFPSSFGRSVTGVGTDTKDAGLQVGQQVEFCSVATSPMTPKTPSTTAFPVLIGRETVKKSEEQKQEGFGATQSSAESERVTLSKEQSEESHASPRSSTSCATAQVTLEDKIEQCKQQRMGSMDQDITIMVTHYDNNEEEDDEQEMVKIDEELGESDVKREDGDDNTSTETPDHTQDTSNTNQTEEQAKADMLCEISEDNKPEVSVKKPPIPESPAPFGCHNVRTQVSLEVVQCQSVATSPMTPPEGDQAFCFPSSIGKCAAMGAVTKDAELQVGQQVEYRSVATAPMTPRTPTVTIFPEIRKGASVDEKIVEEEEDGKEEEVEEEEVEEEEAKEEKKVAAAEEERNCNKEKCEEPVQEVSWDEKGMTWEVYGAVVEVTVLGSAIQKHLEKQVKKRQPSMPPPPPLNPSAVPLTSESAQGGSGKGRAVKRGDGEVSRRRRNPFRLMMENMQQPHCCSKAHTTE